MKMLVMTPKSIDTAEILKAVENAMEGVAKDIKVDFQTTTFTWQHKPEFKIEKLAGTRLIYTTDDVYHMLDVGTVPHEIVAVNAPMLVFPVGGFRPKSRPGYIGSNKGSPAGRDGIRRVKKVHHPGTAAREWADAIQRKWTKLFPNIVQRAIDAAVGRRG